MRYTVRYEISGTGEVEIDPVELEELTIDEIEHYAYDGVELKVIEDHAHVIKITGAKECLRRIMEAKQ